MTQLITVEELNGYLDMGKNPDEKKINPVIQQAQNVELKDYLGTIFYFEVLSNTDSPDYQTLLSGGTFTVNNITYYQEGIKSLLASLFMARFILQINTNITPFGSTVKLSNDSEPTDKATLRDTSFAYKEMAASTWDIIKLYIENNVQIFPNFNKNNTCVLGNPAGEKLRFKFIR